MPSVHIGQVLVHPDPPEPYVEPGRTVEVEEALHAAPQSFFASVALALPAVLVGEQPEPDAIHREHVGLASPLEVGAVFVVTPSVREDRELRAPLFFGPLEGKPGAVRAGVAFRRGPQLGQRGGQVALLVGVGAPVVVNLGRVGSGFRRALEPHVGRLVLAIPVEKLGEVELRARDRVSTKHVVHQARGIPIGRNDARGQAGVVAPGCDEARIFKVEAVIEVPLHGGAQSRHRLRVCVQGELPEIASRIHQQPGCVFGKRGGAGGEHVVNPAGEGRLLLRLALDQQSVGQRISRDVAVLDRSGGVVFRAAGCDGPSAGLCQANQRFGRRFVRDIARERGRSACVHGARARLFENAVHFLDHLSIRVQENDHDPAFRALRFQLTGQDKREAFRGEARNVRANLVHIVPAGIRAVGYESIGEDGDGLQRILRGDGAEFAERAMPAFVLGEREGVTPRDVHAGRIHGGRVARMLRRLLEFTVQC
ncbi:MAG: hypothetical protein BWY59_00542 [Verrucomicrobia bacterium ADurb.Bin345]|nr:MAG: hypothetical protein BWY59_00542 [Verrucomicrobia bacterium ADurb.Bin345]